MLPWVPVLAADRGCGLAQVRENSRARSALLHVMRKKTGLRALDVERAAYKKLGWDDPPQEPAVSEWKGSVPLSLGVYAAWGVCGSAFGSGAEGHREVMVAFTCRHSREDPFSAERRRLQAVTSLVESLDSPPDPLIKPSGRRW